MSKADEEKKAVATRHQSTDVMVVDYDGEEGAGLEGVSRDELRIPILTQLQPMSPQVKPVTAGGTPGAKPGMLLNGATGELFDINETIMPFIPVFRDHVFLEFTPRNLGGGFVAVHSPSDDLIIKLRAEQSKFGRLAHNVTRRNEKGEPLDGTEIIESFALYGLFNILEQPFRAMLPFKSTQIKKYQNFIGRATNFTYPNKEGRRVKTPIYAHLWDLKAAFESNKLGQFYGYHIAQHPKKADGGEDLSHKSLIPKTEAIYEEARAFYQMLKDGKATADFATDKSGEIAPTEEVPM